MSQSSRPKVIDLFAGVGGFSLGAFRAGLDVIAAVDLDERAIEAHSRNFPRTEHLRRNVQKLSGLALRQISKLGEARLDGLIGGPPCQGFSTMGKMRKNDARNKLFYHFFRLVSELQPRFFVAENVPGILDDKYHVLRNEAFNLVRANYDLLNPQLLSAADFGAATARTRVFFIGVAKDSGLDLPKNSITRHSEHTVVRAALAGLPKHIREDWVRESDSWQPIGANQSTFLENINQVVDGVGCDDGLKKFFTERTVSGFLATRHTPEVIDRFSKVEPGKMDRISKFPRLAWDSLCPTLRAGTGSDRGSFQAARPIHPTEPRVITTREAARLQGFPDWFQFDPTKWHSFRQIGNSISPLMSHGVLKALITEWGIDLGN